MRRFACLAQHGAVLVTMNKACDGVKRTPRTRSNPRRKRAVVGPRRDRPANHSAGNRQTDSSR